MAERRGVLVMAYGTPRTLDEVEAYYTDIRHGRPPSPDLLDELIDRYRAIGGRSPLLEITRAQAEGIERRTGIPAYVGHKHAPPFIADAVGAMSGDDVQNAVGIVMAPHYSSMSVGDYERRVRTAADQHGWDGDLTMVKSWHLEAVYLRFLSREVKAALDSLTDGARASSVVLFTAHSLPEKILQRNDPYVDQLHETAAAVAGRTGIDRWEVAWQSAGRTEIPWLGPDLGEVLARLADSGTKGVVVCPCGFVADHLEILYDIDIEATRVAENLGLELARTASPNDDPLLLDALAGVVSRALSPG